MRFARDQRLGFNMSRFEFRFLLFFAMLKRLLAVIALPVVSSPHEDYKEFLSKMTEASGWK